MREQKGSSSGFYGKKLTAFFRHPHSLKLLSVVYFSIAAVVLFAATQSIRAAGSWTQTQWNGGVGASTTNQYVSAQDIEVADGSFALSKTEELTNTSFEDDTTSWGGTETQRTPTLVQAKSVRNGTGLTATATLDSAPTQGNTLVAVVSVPTGGAASIATTSGWSKDKEVTGSGGQVTAIFSKLAGASESATVSFATSPSSVPHIDVMEFSNIKATSPFDQSISSNSGASTVTSFSPGTTPTTTTDEQVAVIGIGATIATAQSASPPSWTNGFANPTIPSSYRHMVAYKILSGKQAVTTTGSWTLASSVVQGAIATYHAADAVSASHETTTKYSGDGAVRLVAGATGVFTQAATVGDTDEYLLSAYAYTNGGAVTSADAELSVNGSTIATTYTSVGGGWYRMTGTATGSVSSQHYGVEVKSGKTVFVDDLSLAKYVDEGSLISNIYDTGSASNWGDVVYTESGTGDTEVRVRSSNNADMSGAPSFELCLPVVSGADLSADTGDCVTDGQRYIQYQVVLSAQTNAATSVFEEITIEYADADSVAPEVNASNIQGFNSDGGTEIASEAWTNSDTPYFTWDAGEDDDAGVGIAGYCLYLGQDETADPVSTKGMLGESPLETDGQCQYAVSTTSLDLSVETLETALSASEDAYYLNIKAIDGAYNVFDGDSEQFAFKFDNESPINPSFVTAPSNFINTKVATLTWSTEDADAASDAHSGVAGLQYKIGINGTWYGDSHSGSEDATDLLANDGSYTTQNTPDFANLQEGNNVIYFRTWDTAGNVTQATVTAALKINTAGAPSSPRNVTATPSTNTENSFAFSWIAPATFVGQASNISYCYTINTQPTAQNCTFTDAGTLSLPAGAYATQPGVNTFFVVARDESNGINYATAASVEFTANTPAPGVPLNIDIADTSVKATENWRLVVSWEAPVETGAGVSKYQIFRSTNGTDYSLAGSTSGTSFVDGNLESRIYYYKIKACDSANNCGAFSGSDSRTPTGRFTTAPALTQTPKLSAVGTKTATISWQTDRNSDSKIALGTKSGRYFATESYNSAKVTNHTVDLTNLEPGTTYYYIAKWTDEDGNTGQSSELTFATLPPPIVEDVKPTSVSLKNANIQYTTTGAYGIRLYYGKTNSFGGVVKLNTSPSKSTYTSSLTGLEDGTKYFYKINTIDSAGNEYTGTTLSFSTPPAPRITNVRFQPIKNEPSSSQKITWETNVPATSEVSYGVSGLSETINKASLSTRHEVIIRGLKDDSRYRLIARSRDAKGNVATSDEQVFKTALDTRPPKISDIVVDSSIRGTGAEARGQIVVSWRTDEPSTSQVAYGEGSSGFLSSTTSEDARLSYEHIVVISDLSPSRVYHLEPRSFDKARNKGAGEEQVVIIGRASDNVLSIIFNALQQLFGF